MPRIPLLRKPLATDQRGAPRPSRVRLVKPLILMMIVAASVTVTEATDAQTTLKEALQKTYETNPHLASQRASQRATDEEIAQAKENWFRPTISTNGGIGYTHDDSTDGFNAAAAQGQQSAYTQDAHTPDANVSLNLPIFMSGQTFYGIKQAEATVDVGQWNLVAAEQSILSQAASAYAEIVLYSGLVKIALEELDAYLPLLKMTESMFKSRTSTITDVAQVRSEIAQSRASLAVNQGSLDTYRATYEAIVGEAPDNLAPLPRLDAGPTTLEAAEKLMMEQNPLIRSAEFSVRQSQFEIKSQKSALLPTLQVSASYGQSWQYWTATQSGQRQNGSTDSGNASVNLVANIPLYTGGVKYSYIRQSMQQNISNEKSLQNVKRTQAGTLKGAWLERDSQIKVVKAYEDAIGSSRTAVTGKIHEFKNGTTSMQEVINAQENLYNVLSERAQASYQLFNLELSIVQSLGSLTATGLDLRVPIYRPEKYRDEIKNKWIGW